LRNLKRDTVKMYNFGIESKLDKILYKISRKDPVLHKQIMNKIKEIVNCYDIESYKNLRHDLKEYKRVHIGHFVLIFKFDKTNNAILFTDFDHHDKIYYN
jgi:YafQ family addiction module toxin component